MLFLNVAHVSVCFFDLRKMRFTLAVMKKKAGLTAATIWLVVD